MKTLSAHEVVNVSGAFGLFDIFNVPTISFSHGVNFDAPDSLGLGSIAAGIGGAILAGQYIATNNAGKRGR